MVTAMQTKLCKTLGIKHPIISGAMYGFTSPGFVAAVSNAGALGTLTASACGKTAKDLQDSIHKVKMLTKNPFSVNVSLFPSIVSPELAQSYFRVIIEEGVKVVETSGQSPKAYLPMLKDANIFVIHKAPAVRYAKSVAKAGVDAVCLVGVECAGRPGADEVSTMAMLAAAEKELELPIIAAGGIANGASLAAALALGAQAAVMGTRMLATQENSISEVYKNKIVNATENDTVLLRRVLSSPERLFANETVRKVLEMEEKNIAVDKNEIDRIERQYLDEKDPEKSYLAMGQSAGQIHSIETVKDVVESINAKADDILRALAAQI